MHVVVFWGIALSWELRVMKQATPPIFHFWRYNCRLRCQWLFNGAHWQNEFSKCCSPLETVEINCFAKVLVWQLERKNRTVWYRQRGCVDRATGDWNNRNVGDLGCSAIV